MHDQPSYRQRQEAMSRARVLGLSEETNPEYYGLFKRYHDLMREWNRINKELVAFRMRRYRFRRWKQDLKALGPDMAALQAKYIEWNRDVDTFGLKPKLVFTRDQDHELGMVHYPGLLRDMTLSMSKNMGVLIQIHEKRWDEYREQLNFKIGSILFILAVMAVIIAITGGQ